MLSALEARLVVIVLTLIAFIAVATVMIRPAAERVDAAELCVGVESDGSAVCVPLP